MQDPSEMVLSAIEFGVKRTEDIVRAVARLGFSATRSVLGAALHAVTGNASAEAPRAGAAESEPHPASSPELSPRLAPEPSPRRDSERERRIALRDQPTDSEKQSPHHSLNNPVTDDPDPTEWPDPYDRREDPRDPDSDAPVLPGEVPHTATGSHSTSAPHPSQDPEAERWNGPKRRTQANERS